MSFTGTISTSTTTFSEQFNGTVDAHFKPLPNQDQFYFRSLQPGTYLTSGEEIIRRKHDGALETTSKLGSKERTQLINRLQLNQYQESSLSDEKENSDSLRTSPGPALGEIVNVTNRLKRFREDPPSARELNCAPRSQRDQDIQLACRECGVFASLKDLEKQEKRSILRQFSKENVTTFCLSPSYYQIMLKGTYRILHFDTSIDESFCVVIKTENDLLCSSQMNSSKVREVIFQLQEEGFKSEDLFDHFTNLDAQGLSKNTFKDLARESFEYYPQNDFSGDDFGYVVLKTREGELFCSQLVSKDQSEEFRNYLTNKGYIAANLSYYFDDYFENSGLDKSTYEHLENGEFLILKMANKDFCIVVRKHNFKKEGRLLCTERQPQQYLKCFVDFLQKKKYQLFKNL